MLVSKLGGSGVCHLLLLVMSSLDARWVTAGLDTSKACGWTLNMAKENAIPGAGGCGGGGRGRERASRRAD